MFFGFLHTGEVVVPSNTGFSSNFHLAVGDISMDSHSSPSYLVVCIKVSKTDPFRQGLNIYLGRTDNDLYPVIAILRYMAQRGAMAGPFFMEDV